MSLIRKSPKFKSPNCRMSHDCVPEITLLLLYIVMGSPRQTFSKSFKVISVVRNREYCFCLSHLHCVMCET